MECTVSVRDVACPCTSHLSPLTPPLLRGPTHLYAPPNPAQTRFLGEMEKVEPPPLPRSIVPHRADLLRLYVAFLRTPHFANWWDRRRRRAAAAL